VYVSDYAAPQKCSACELLPVLGAQM